MTITAVHTMAQCEDCATLVDVQGEAITGDYHYCERHTR